MHPDESGSPKYCTPLLSDLEGFGVPRIGGFGQLDVAVCGRRSASPTKVVSSSLGLLPCWPSLYVTRLNPFRFATHFAQQLNSRQMLGCGQSWTSPDRNRLWGRTAIRKASMTWADEGRGPRDENSHAPPAQNRQSHHRGASVLVVCHRDCPP